jgi:glycosyltransferase involved in cell wall biosynthesis
MKIAHLIWGLDVGGAETMLVDIANEQALSAEVAIVVGNAAIDSTVFATLSSKVVTNLVRRPPGSRNPWHLLKLIHMLRKFSPDIVHAHQASFSKIARTLSAPMVLTVHETNVRLESIERYAAIYGISEAVRNDLLARHSICSPTVIHNGICFSKIPQKTSYGRFPFRIVQVGLLSHDKKGQDILLRALQHVSGEMGDGQVLIDFIGAGTSREYLRNLAEQLGVAKWCRFLGQQPRSVIYDQLRTYDLLVQPSRYEGFGLTIVEAMAARVPVLVSDIEGPMEVIDHGNYGYFFWTGDHVDCGDKIALIMKDSQRDGVQEFLQGIAEYARRRFDVATTAKSYLDEYKKVILRSTPA